MKVRHLEAIMRIAESFCKMRLSEYCSAQDIDRAIAVTVDSFIGSQKVSCKKALSRAFAKYVFFFTLFPLFSFLFISFFFFFFDPCLGCGHGANVVGIRCHDQNRSRRGRLGLLRRIGLSFRDGRGCSLLLSDVLYYVTLVTVMFTVCNVLGVMGFTYILVHTIGYVYI